MQAVIQGKKKTPAPRLVSFERGGEVHPAWETRKSTKPRPWPRGEGGKEKKKGKKLFSKERYLVIRFELHKKGSLSFATVRAGRGSERPTARAQERGVNESTSSREERKKEKKGLHDRRRLAQRRKRGSRRHKAYLLTKKGHGGGSI